MKKYMSYILFCVISISALMIFQFNPKSKVFTKNLFYMDTYINIKIYTDNNQTEKIFSEVENIYKDYHELTDRYNNYENLVNVYYINNNSDAAETLEIDERLYDILKYSLEWKEKTNGLFNIELGSVIESWKKYFLDSNGIPSQEELDNAFKNIKEVKLLDNNQILNNKPNIDLGAIAKGYATGVVGQFLKDKGYNKYIINAGGHVLVGDKYKESGYKIGIKNPIVLSENLSIIEGENICVATSGSYERFYEYDGKRYSHIINPKTLYPADYMKSVTVISNDSKLNDILTTTLFLMPIDEGIKFVNDFDGVEAIWIANDGQITKSKGFKNYEQK